MPEIRKCKFNFLDWRRSPGRKHLFFFLVPSPRPLPHCFAAWRGRKNARLAPEALQIWFAAIASIPGW